MAFAITPSNPTRLPVAVDQGAPRFIQFQSNGVNLGGPDADTVNFIGEIVAVRGTSGGDENTVTVMLLDPVPPSS